MSGLCSVELEGPRMARCSRGWDAQKDCVALTKESYRVRSRNCCRAASWRRFALRCDAMRCDQQVGIEMLGARAVADAVAVAVGWDAQQQGKEKGWRAKWKKRRSWPDRG